MICRILLFAQRGGSTDGINKWLGEHPAVIGLIALAIGAVALIWGIVELRSGVATDKRGKDHTGATAKALAITRIVIGSIICLFGLYKIIVG